MNCQYCGATIAFQLTSCLHCGSKFGPFFEFVPISAKFMLSTDSPLETIEHAGRVCYQSESRKDPVAFYKMLLQRGHESVLEHVSFTFDCVCDRGVSHELVRHRIASYSQESTRYCNYAGKRMQFILPSGLSDEGVYDLCTFLVEVVKTYKMLAYKGCSPQQARAVLPNCLKTNIIVTMNLREFRHFLRLRQSKAAHPEMQTLAGKMREHVDLFCPELLEDIK
jgi:thymidylate synthase (FAD)